MSQANVGEYRDSMSTEIPSYPRFSRHWLTEPLPEKRSKALGFDLGRAALYVFDIPGLVLITLTATVGMGHSLPEPDPSEFWGIESLPTGANLALTKGL